MAPTMWTSSTLANTAPSSPRLRYFNGSDPITATGSAAPWQAEQIRTRFTNRWIIPTDWITVLFFSLLLLTLRRKNQAWIDLCTHGVLPFRRILPMEADGRVWDKVIFSKILSFKLSTTHMANDRQEIRKRWTMLWEKGIEYSFGFLILPFIFCFISKYYITVNYVAT